MYKITTRGWHKLSTLYPSMQTAQKGVSTKIINVKKEECKGWPDPWHRRTDNKKNKILFTFKLIGGIRSVLKINQISNNLDWWCLISKTSLHGSGL